MIFPWWVKYEDFFKAPVTMALFFISLFFLMILPPVSKNVISQLESQMADETFLMVQSIQYQKYLKSKNPDEYQKSIQSWTGRNYDANKVHLYWSQQSFRDDGFILDYKNIKPYSDEVLYNNWLKVWDRFLLTQKFQWTTFYGVSILNHKWTSYITYQFVHSGLLHFISNMMLLIFFGIALEKMVGGFVVAIVYLICGVLGALVYELSHGMNAAALVGASASVSGVMAFYFLVETKRNLKFFYFFAPQESFFGDIYLRKEWLITLFFLNDIVAVYSTPSWQLGVAHAAHLGAVVVGFILAFVYNFYDSLSKLSFKLKL